MVALLTPGDEVLLPDPGWPTYQMAVASVNARSVPYRLHAGAGFIPDPEEIEALITDRTRMLVVNSPSNPLGTVLDQRTLAGLIEIARRHDLWILSDECYDQLVLEGKAIATAALEGAEEHVVAVYSMSKTYAMTGFRVGYVKGPATVMAAMVKLQEAQVACVNAAAQWASVAALTGPQDAVAEAVSAYRHRRDAAIEIAQARGLRVQPPAGAFYLWVELDGLVEDSTLFATRLLDQERVAVAPGLTFGSGGRSAVRIALAAPADVITEGIERLATFAASC